MKGLSKKEMEILLLLLKDIAASYNSSNMAKKIGITPAGAFKAMKKLEKAGLIAGKRMGKAIFYRIRLEDQYALRTMEALLMQEARENALRWLEEFKELCQHAEIVLLFGSAVRNPKNANDIDILVITEKGNAAIDNIIKERKKIAIKPIHVIKSSLKELSKSIKEKNEAMLNIIRHCYVLHGYEKLLEVVKDVAGG